MPTISNDFTHKDSLSFNAHQVGWRVSPWHLGYEYVSPDNTRRIYVEFRRDNEAINRAQVGRKSPEGSGYETDARVESRNTDKLATVLGWLMAKED